MKNKMRKKLKAELARFYEAPKPLKKQIFFQSIEQNIEQSIEQNIKQSVEQNIESEPLNIFHIFTVQLSYISKWTWLTSVVFLQELC